MKFITKFAIALIGWNFVPPAEARSRPAVARLDQRQTIILYDGVVDGKSAQRFLDLISRNEDRIIGLKIQADPIETSRYSVNVVGDQLVITAGNPLDAPRELVVNGPVGSSLTYHLIDGFYLIKFGGSHAAGALSWGALPVDEAKIRLDSKIRVIRKTFR